MIVQEVTRMIAKVRGHSVERCNDKCQCYPLALEIVTYVTNALDDDRNALAEKLYEAKNELMNLKRFVGE